MNHLIIKLTGTVNSSNFDEWKNDLIAQIQSTNTELVTDEDFVAASNQVKLFKSAETSLKQAKQSAIDQAEEIQRLFSAIDEITEEARQARLTLERQIKARKLEIKKHYIQSGIAEIEKFIDEQIDELKYCDKTVFLDRGRFESAASGKAGTKGLQNAISDLCSIIKVEVSNKAITLSRNKAKIDALPEGYKLLLQDWNSLLDLSENELELEIDKRIARYNEETAREKAENHKSELAKEEDIELNSEQTTSTEIDSTPKEKYRIVIDLLATKGKAIEMARSVRSNFSDDSSISAIRLTRNRDD